MCAAVIILRLNDLVLVVLRIIFVVSIVPNVVIGEVLHHEWDSSDRSPTLQAPIHGKCFGDGILTHNTRLRTYSAVDDEPKG